MGRRHTGEFPSSPTHRSTKPPRARHPEAAGFRVGPYEIVRRLPAGEMCEVFVGREGPGGPLVVIKRLSPGFNHNDRVRRLFANEIRTSLLLRHPNVVGGLAHGSDDDGPFLVLEFVDGPDLDGLARAVRREGLALGLPLSIHVAAQALAGLHHAHNARDARGTPLGLVHRDVSPENLLCGRNGQVKLTDFGIAKLTALQSFTDPRQGLMGKLSFMSPERARGDPCDARADQFSTALILYELCTGMRAYPSPGPGAGLMEVMDQVEAARVVAPRKVNPEVPRALEDSIMRALSPRPRDRYPDCMAFREALLAVADKVYLQASAVDLAALLEEMDPAAAV